jgi:hypothetical protein
MWSFYLQIRVATAIANWPFFWNVSPNLQLFLVLLYGNLLYASQIFWYLSIEYNEVHLYLPIMWKNSKTKSFFFQSKRNKLMFFPLLLRFEESALQLLHPPWIAGIENNIRFSLDSQTLTSKTKAVIEKWSFQ